MNDLYQQYVSSDLPVQMMDVVDGDGGALRSIKQHVPEIFVVWFDWFEFKIQPQFQIFYRTDHGSTNIAPTTLASTSDT